METKSPARKETRKGPAPRLTKSTKSAMPPEATPFANAFHYLDAWFALLGPAREEGESLASLDRIPDFDERQGYLTFLLERTEKSLAAGTALPFEAYVRAHGLDLLDRVILLALLRMAHNPQERGGLRLVRLLRALGANSLERQWEVLSRVETSGRLRDLFAVHCCPSANRLERFYRLAPWLVDPLTTGEGDPEGVPVLSPDPVATLDTLTFEALNVIEAVNSNPTQAGTNWQGPATGPGWDLAVRRDPDALVGIEVALHRDVVFIDGRIAAGTGTDCAVSEPQIARATRAVFREVGYGPDGFGPSPSAKGLRVEFDLCLVPLEQALARDFAKALEDLRRASKRCTLGPDGKVLIAVRGPRLEAVSLSVHHVPDAEWGALTFAVKEACLAVAAEYIDAGELEPLDEATSWLFNGAGSFAIGGPLGDNGLSGKKLVAEAFGTAVPIGGGTIHGKDPKKPDVRATRLGRERAVALVRGGAEEATVWVVFRPGDEEPRWVEERVVPAP